MDKELIKARFTEAVETYDSAAVVQRRIAERLFGMMSPIICHDGCIFEAGCGTGMLSRLIVDGLSPRRLTMIDLAERYRDCFGDLDPEQVVFVSGDAEEYPLPNGLDAVVSSSAIQWFEKPEIFIRRSCDALVEGGVLAIATFGVENMREIGTLSGVRLNYPDNEALKGMIPDSMELMCFKEEIVTMIFPSVREVLRHLRKTGVSGIERPLGVSATRRLMEDYRLRYADSDGNVPLTYHPVYMVARKRG